MSSGQKVATGIGLLLGGFSSGLTGRANPAQDFLNKQIDRDIAAQESRVGQQKTILGANENMFRDKTLALQMTRINMNDIYSRKIQIEASKLGTPQAKANADALSAQYAMQNAQLMQSMSTRAAALGALNSGKTLGIDPAQLVPHLVPKEHQTKALAEIQIAQNTRHMGASIMKAFDDAVKSNTAMKTGFGKLRTPAEVFALHQAMQPTFQDLEGTVRQAAMDNTFKNITPMPGDMDHTIKYKRGALEDYLKSKMSAPTAKAYGVDLQKFESTRARAPGEGQIKYRNGVPYQSVPGGWKRVQ